MPDKSEDTRNPRCSFLQIEKKLDRANRMLHFAGIVANDYPNREGLTEGEHKPRLYLRKEQLKDSLSESCSILLDVVDTYEHLVRVCGYPTCIPEYYCIECTDCSHDEELDCTHGLDCYKCPLRSEESYTGIRKRIETEIHILAKLLVLASDDNHGCGEFPYQPEARVPGFGHEKVRDIIRDWVKQGYYHDRWQHFSGKDDE